MGSRKRAPELPMRWGCEAVVATWLSSAASHKLGGSGAASPTILPARADPSRSPRGVADMECPAAPRDDWHGLLPNRPDVRRRWWPLYRAGLPVRHFLSSS